MGAVVLPADHVSVDRAAEGTRVPSAVPISPPSSLRHLLKRKVEKKFLLKACAYECFITHFSFDCKAAF